MLSEIKLFEYAKNERRESKHLDFKREFNADSPGDWCETIKDIIAFANSGGGIIVFGIDDDGVSSGIDVSLISSMDIADITNKIERYTNYQFAEIAIIEIDRDGVQFPAFKIIGTEIPIIFTRPGTYAVDGGRQKTAFAQGTIYFRHGAKSEPGNHDDLVKWRDRAIEKIRKGWLGGIRKVVEAPAGHVITAIPALEPSLKNIAFGARNLSIAARVSTDPNAIRFIPQNIEEFWPYRQKNLLNEINENLQVKPVVNGHDIFCINKHLNILTDHPEFAYRPHRLASPQYNSDYANWVIKQYKDDKKFFKKMRAEHRKRSK